MSSYLRHMSEEINRLFMELLERAKQKMGAEIATWNKVFQFEVPGVEPYYVEFKGGEVRIVSGKHPSPTATLSMSQDIILKILKGELDAMAAFMKGMMRITGNVMETVHLRRVIEVGLGKA